ncbi:hypothetical protein AVEN_265361-1 [Araneus ventricosus]|uniref:Uncharacterized protein n=1 Tax=Araneus ventricosus TaxID=182803 RepID=A0A4Y2MCA9_ARAVE|nr:hypothetical protein AVEN_265361-1 [Araneus ventricosus]
MASWDIFQEKSAQNCVTHPGKHWKLTCSSPDNIIDVCTEIKDERLFLFAHGATYSVSSTWQKVMNLFLSVQEMGIHHGHPF